MQRGGGGIGILKSGDSSHDQEKNVKIKNMNLQSARQAKENSMFMEREKEIHRLSNNFCRAL